MWSRAPLSHRASSKRTPERRIYEVTQTRVISRSVLSLLRPLTSGGSDKERNVSKPTVRLASPLVPTEYAVKRARSKGGLKEHYLFNPLPGTSGI